MSNHPISDGLERLIGQTVKSVALRTGTIQDQHFGPISNQVLEVYLTFENGDHLNISVAVDATSGLHCSTGTWGCC